jgi:hypothetical protein
MREMEPVILQAIEADFDRAALGLRLRYLSDGMSDDARLAGHHVLPERSGYYLGARLVAGAVEARGLPWALRATATEILGLSSRAAATAS